MTRDQTLRLPSTGIMVMIGFAIGTFSGLFFGGMARYGGAVPAVLISLGVALTLLLPLAYPDWAEPQPLVNVILHGQSRTTHGQEYYMPGFAQTLSDGEVVSLASYVLRRFGRPEVKVLLDDVKSLS